MKAVACKSCGSTDLYAENGYRVCRYCGTRHIITSDDKVSYSEIALDEDVKRLLKKCREDPSRAHKYAELILEIDPSNSEARSYLINASSNASNSSNNSSGGCYVATAVYGSYDCPQVWTLRRYRDDMLSKTWYGRAFIRVYYATSPTLVKWFGDSAWFTNFWKSKLDSMVSTLNEAGVLDIPYVDR